MLQTLKSKEGEAFNEMYLDSVVRYHQAFDGKMENIISDTDYDGLIDLARAIYAHSYVHLNQAQQLQ